MSSLPVTAPQRRVLKALGDSWATFGLAPTLRELAERLGITKTAVHETVVRLERRGLVTRQVGLARTLRLTPEGAAEGGER